MTERRALLSAATLGAAAAAAIGPASAQDQPPRPLSGRVALVTGAARGIGRAAALELAHQGAAVALLDIAEPDAIPAIDGYRLSGRGELEEAVRLVRATGIRALALAADVRDREALRRAAEQVAAELGGPDIVVANAGVAAGGRLEEFDPDRWRAMLDVNLLGVAHTVWAALPALRASSAGRVVIVTSVQGRMGAPGSSAYAASKWGATGLMKSLAAELGPEGIAVNAVAPTAVETALYRRGERAQQREDDPQEMAQRLGHALPVGVLEPVEIARAIAFLAGPQAAFVSGVTLDVNAGRSARLTA